MKKGLLLSGLLLLVSLGYAQLNPAITAWLQNTTETGSFYMSGNSTAIDNGILYNCQSVEYSDDFVYVSSNGIPAYPTGPFLDGNPSQASSQNAIFRLPLDPQENTGNPTSTNGGNIGIFINGVALFDFRDGVGWNPNTNALCGGPGNPPCPGGPMGGTDWRRDAIPAERPGFDCSKAHPAMGNYHHHQNPSAFKLDLDVVSDICNLYDADGLYAIDENQHSPLIGYAYDGFPIYGAYGYQNTDGTGEVVRIKSSYQLRNITSRITAPDGSNSDMGPDVSDTYPLGYFREDYEYVVHPSEEDFLDEHNGRFCVTPEYPDGIYAYFATVDENWNSAYPYVVGPTFFGVSANRKVSSITEATTVYTAMPNSTTGNVFDRINISIFPNPATDLIAVQLSGLVEDDVKLELVNTTGQVLKTAIIEKGSTIAYFDVQTIYEGVYIIRFSDKNGQQISEKIVITKS